MFDPCKRYKKIWQTTTQNKLKNTQHPIRNISTTIHDTSWQGLYKLHDKFFSPTWTWIHRWSSGLKVNVWLPITKPKSWKPGGHQPSQPAPPTSVGNVCTKHGSHTHKTGKQKTTWHHSESIQMHIYWFIYLKPFQMKNIGNHPYL